MEDKEDLRVRRTRKLLVNSLLSLLQEQSFETIKVSDICEKCMVHRATFYNHFTDKNDLLNYTIDQIQEEMFESTMIKGKYDNSKEMYLDLINNVIDYLNENRALFKPIIKNVSEKVVSLIDSSVKKSIVYLLSKTKDYKKLSIPMDLVVDFFAGGITSVGLEWLKSDSPYSKEELLMFFNLMINSVYPK